jgi:hypothetical protein
MTFDFSDYFHYIAVTLKDIAHTGQKRKFHRVSGITQLEELLHNLTRTTDDGYQLVIEDNLDSRFYYNSATLLDQQYYVFYVLKKCRVNDFDSIEQAKEGCKAVAKKIWSKMFRDHESDWRSFPSPRGEGQGVRSNASGLKDLRKDSISVNTVGPLADQYWGLMCAFTVADNPRIRYNPDDWLP